MIDLNKLVEIADNNKVPSFEKQMGEMINIFNSKEKEYEKYIDDNLLKKANKGNRTLTIDFKVNDFTSFHAIAMNFFNYYNHGYKITMSALNGEKNNHISNDDFFNFIDYLAHLKDKDYLFLFSEKRNFHIVSKIIFRKTIDYIRFEIEF